jgi:hypothetical protein
MIACENGPTGFGARSVEIARSFAPEGAGLLSAPPATPGATAAANPLAAALRKNVLRFITFLPQTEFQISNFRFQIWFCNPTLRGLSLRTWTALASLIILPASFHIS